MVGFQGGGSLWRTARRGATLVGLIIAASAALSAVESPRGEWVSSAEAADPAQTFELDVSVAPGLLPSSVVLGATGSLRLDDRAKAEAPVSNLGAVSTEFGVEAQGTDVYSEPDLTLRDRATLSGAAVVGGSVYRGNDTTIAGGVTTGASFADPTGTTFVVTFPAGPPTNIDLQPDQSLTLTPGVAYGSVSIKSRATVFIPPGTYTLGSLDIEPDAHVILEDTGTIEMFVLDSIIWRGVLETQSGNPADWLLGYLGTGSVVLEAPFSGLIVAPNGQLVLGSFTGPPPPFSGQFFAKDIEVRPDALVAFRASPFLNPPITATGEPYTTDLSCTQSLMPLSVIGPPVDDGGQLRYSGVSSATVHPECGAVELCQNADVNSPRITPTELNQRLNDPATPTTACTAEGQRSLSDCRGDPTTVDPSRTCNNDSDCSVANGERCTEYCVDSACTQRAHACAMQYDCSGTDDDTEGCDVEPIYQCTDPADVGTTTPGEVSSQLPPDDTVDTHVDPDAMAQLDPYKSLTNVTFCNTNHTLYGATVDQGDSYTEPQGADREAVSAEEEQGAPVKLGSDDWNLFANPKLFHSANVSHKGLDQFDFSLRAEGSLVAGARVLGHPITALDVDGGVSATQCGIDTSSKFQLFGEDIAAFPSTSTDPALTDACTDAFGLVSAAQTLLEPTVVLTRQIVQAYQTNDPDQVCALFLAAFNPDPTTFNCANFTSEQLVNFVVHRYDALTELYAQRRHDFLMQAVQAADVHPSATLLDIDEPFSIVGVHQAIPIGPVAVVVDAQLYGEWFLKGGLDFDLSMGQVQGNEVVGDPQAHAGAFFTPGVSLTASLYVGVGFDIGVAGASVGLEGVLRLLEADAPVRASIGIARQTVPETDASPGHDYRTSDFAGTPIPGIPIGEAYQWRGDWNFGAAFGLASLNGQLNAAARVHFLFFSKTFRRKIADWTGFEKQYFPIAVLGGSFTAPDASGLFPSDSAFNGLLDFGDFGEVFAYTQVPDVGTGQVASFPYDDDVPLNCVIIL